MAGWKTLVFNGGVGIAALIAELLDHLGVVPVDRLLRGDKATWIAVALGAANIGLRHVTSRPAGWRK